MFDLELELPMGERGGERQREYSHPHSHPYPCFKLSLTHFVRISFSPTPFTAIKIKDAGHNFCCRLVQHILHFFWLFKQKLDLLSSQNYVNSDKKAANRHLSLFKIIILDVETTFCQIFPSFAP